MHHTLVLLVMASIVASAPTYASGSCLSYGHSCWGAHGKRSNQDQTQMFVSKLGPIGLTERQAKLTEYLLSQQQKQEAQRSSEDIGDDDVGRREVIVMEQPPRLYEILNQLSRTYGKNPILNNQ